MTDLRKLAKDKPCLVRIPGVCNHNPETTVLAHYSLTGISGWRLKSPDWIGAWCCSSCHDEVDGRTHCYYLHTIADAHPNDDNLQTLAYETIRLMHAQGVFRTQYELIKLGVIK